MRNNPNNLEVGMKVQGDGGKLVGIISLLELSGRTHVLIAEKKVALRPASSLTQVK
jgi:hypothetical protein